MVFLWFSYGFPMVFLWFSYGFSVNPHQVMAQILQKKLKPFKGSKVTFHNPIITYGIRLVLLYIYIYII